MKQKTYCANTMEELSAALAEIGASSEYREASDVLVHVLSDLLPQERAAEVLAKVRAALPRAKTLGLSVNKFRERVDETLKNVQLSVCFFARSKVEVREYDEEGDLTALGAKIAAELSASRSASCRERVGWVRCSDSAAFEIFCSRTTARKYRKTRISMCTPLSSFFIRSPCFNAF